MNKKNGGYLILEVLVAAMVFVAILIPVFTSISYLQIKTRQSKYDSEAAVLLQEAMEIAGSLEKLFSLLTKVLRKTKARAHTLVRFDIKF